jgi:hypothetical protein
LEYIIIFLQFYDHVSPYSQRGRSDALSRCSYLIPKEGDAIYDQEYSVLLKPERLHLKTLHTTTSKDPAFLKDIRINLLSDPLALKFKQSCANFKPQNGQIEVPDSQTLYLEILDPESPDFQNSSLQINKLHKDERPQDDTDPRF